MSTAERQDILSYLAAHPKSGDLIEGSGGIRKLRWSRGGRGKSGGIRVIYYYHSELMPLQVTGSGLAFAQSPIRSRVTGSGLAFRVTGSGLAFCHSLPICLARQTVPAIAKTNPMDYHATMITIAEVPEYIRQAEKLMSAAERQDILSYLAAHPKSGDLIERKVTGSEVTK